MEASDLSDTEVKALVIRMLYSIKKQTNIETMKKDQPEMKNIISEMNTLDKKNSRLDEAEDQINNLDDEVEKNTQSEKLEKLKKK